eukprot:3399133-Pyramimonas_sp.AAC.1
MAWSQQDARGLDGCQASSKDEGSPTLLSPNAGHAHSPNNYKVRVPLYSPTSPVYASYPARR